MAIRITHRRMTTYGTTHEHIARLYGYDDRSNLQHDGTREQWYDYVKSGGYVYTLDDRGDKPSVLGRVSAAGNKYVQTAADGIWKDNLLALPLY